MCIIIHKPKGAEFDEQLFRTALFLNPDGAGIMFAENGKVTGKKGLFKPETVVQMWHENQHRDFAIHLRFATSGDVVKENTHPFQVLNLIEHGRDIWLMHNGTISTVKIEDKKRSDTYHFVENYLKPLLAINPDQLYDETFQKFLGLAVAGSRLLFMEGDGRVTIINKEQGKIKSGCWISNTYSIVQPKNKQIVNGSDKPMGPRYDIVNQNEPINSVIGEQLKLLF
jgi:Glutamine amidotransferases class-II